MVQHLPRMLMCEIQYSALEIIISTFLNQKSCRNAQGRCSGLCYCEQNTEAHYCSINRLVQLLCRLISLLVDKYLKISKNPITKIKLHMSYTPLIGHQTVFTNKSDSLSTKQLSTCFFQPPIHHGHFLVEFEFYYILVSCC